MNGTPQKFRSGGFEFRLLERVGNIALLSKSKGRVTSYEVVRIRHYPARVMFGRSYPAREQMPPSASWGKDGWTFNELDGAKAKLSLLTRAQEARIARTFSAAPTFAGRMVK